MTKLIDEKDLLNIEEGLASFGKINNAYFKKNICEY